MSTTRPHQRVFALIGALLFLVTSMSLTILVIWQMKQDSSQSTTSSSQQTSNGGKQLQGTQLNNFTPVATVDKLQIIDLKEGTGEAAKATDTITAHYTGAVAATGIIFQSSYDNGQPATFPLNGVIQGWQDGVPGMKVGGTRRLIIPADQAYGANAPAGSGIPPNAPLVFDIDLVSIQK